MPRVLRARNKGTRESERKGEKAREKERVEQSRTGQGRAERSRAKRITERRSMGSRATGRYQRDREPRKEFIKLICRGDASRKFRR